MIGWWDSGIAGTRAATVELVHHDPPDWTDADPVDELSIDPGDGEPVLVLRMLCGDSAALADALRLAADELDKHRAGLR